MSCIYLPWELIMCKSLVGTPNRVEKINGRGDVLRCIALIDREI